MPRVSEAGSVTGVQTQELRTPQMRAPDTSGLRGLASDLAQTGRQIGEQQRKEQMDLAQARVDEAENNLHTDLLAIETEFQQLKGKDAVDGQRDYWDKIDGAIANHRSGLKTKMQERIYNQMANSRKRNLQRSGEVYSRGQLENFKLQQQGATINNSIEDSTLSPFRAIQNQAVIDNQLDEMFKGQSADFIEEQKREKRSAHMMAVATSMIAQERPEMAKMFLDGMKEHYGEDPLDTEDRTKFEQDYERIYGKVTVSRAVGQVYDAQSDDYEGMLDQLWSQFADKPEYFEEASRLLSTRMSARDKTVQAQSKSLRNELIDGIEKGTFSWENVTPEQIDMLTSEDQSAIKRYEYISSIKENEEGSINALVDYIALPNEQKRDPEILRMYMLQMNAEQQNTARALYQSLTLQTTKTAEVGIQESRALAVKQMFQMLGIDGNSNAKQAKQVQLTNMYYSALDRYAQQNGREPDRAATQQIQQDIMKQVAIYDGYNPREDNMAANIFRDPTVPAYRFEIPEGREGNSLMSPEDRARAIEAIKAQEERLQRFIPLTPAIIWETHLKLRGQSFRDETSQLPSGENPYEELGVTTYEEALAIADSEIPTEQSPRAREIITEVDRLFEIQSTTDPMERLQLMNDEERSVYLKSLDYETRLRWFKANQNVS